MCIKCCSFYNFCSDGTYHNHRPTPRGRTNGGECFGSHHGDECFDSHHGDDVDDSDDVGLDNVDVDHVDNRKTATKLTTLPWRNCLLTPTSKPAETRWRLFSISTINLEICSFRMSKFRLMPCLGLIWTEPNFGPKAHCDYELANMTETMNEFHIKQGQY